MKKIIFIDNDDIRKANETVKHFVLPCLIKGGFVWLTENDITIIPDFSSRNSDENYDLIFDPNNIIVTWSMFTNGGSVSLQQLKRFMTGAGSYNKKNLVFIDTACYLIKACENIITEASQRNIVYFMIGINNNFIIQCNSSQCDRLMIDFNEKNMIRLDHFDLASIIYKPGTF